MRRMGGGVAIIPTAQEYDRTPSIPFPFRPNSNFLYLSGFCEPNAVIVLFGGKSILFCQEKNEGSKIWTGDVLGPEGAVSELGFNEAYPIEKLDEKMLEFLAGQKQIFAPYADKSLIVRAFGWIEKMNKQKPHVFEFSPNVSDVCQPLAEMRLIKDAEEIEMMRKAAEISTQAHNKVLSACCESIHKSIMEQELETVFHKHCRDFGCDPLHAYPTIVAGGKNACVLHYTKNNRVLKDGDLVLVDAGGEFHGYAADITRTFPVNGKFSSEQRALYEIVLEAQKAAIEQVQPGNTCYDPHIAAACVITGGLADLGLLVGDLADLIGNESYKKFFPHRTSHWLGLDVHDVGDYKVNGEWRRLEAGMVLTVEPGIYVQPDDESVEKKWRGVGIRIEDDILVTETGHEILSAAAPKEIDEIEKLVGGRK
jgi:Xaa-Pro aminopeptidase